MNEKFILAIDARIHSLRLDQIDRSLKQRIDNLWSAAAIDDDRIQLRRGSCRFLTVRSSGVISIATPLSSSIVAQRMSSVQSSKIGHPCSPCGDQQLLF
jgi:hypothetical protein